MLQEQKSAGTTARETITLSSSESDNENTREADIIEEMLVIWNRAMAARHNHHEVTKKLLKRSSNSTTTLVFQGRLIYLNGGTSNRNLILNALRILLLLFPLLRPVLSEPFQV